MKENKYDDETFFHKYAQMDRSVKGLSGAGEWRTLQRMLPDFTDKQVLDLGCGYGWHCLYAAQNGARRVVGVDISKKMLEKAREQCFDERIEYVCAPIEDIEYPAGTFDIILSSLAFHYVADFAGTANKISAMLKPGGRLVFSAEHPVFTAQGKQDWIYGENGSKLYFPVDRYFDEGAREAVFLGERVVKYHRTLTAYYQALTDAGLRVVELAEPKPDDKMLAEVPEMADELRRPMMIIFSAVKA